jgi:dihydrofolate reductase
MPWPRSAIREDMKHFKETTTGNKDGRKNLLIAGRLTFEAIGNVLPNRYMGIISHELTGNPCSINEDLFLGDSVPKLVTWAVNNIHNLGDIYLIGGESIWEEGFKIATHAYITVVYHAMNDQLGTRKLKVSLPAQAVRSGFIRGSKSNFFTSDWNGPTSIEISRYWHPDRGLPDWA